jgi:hypothetical protein
MTVIRAPIPTTKERDNRFQRIFWELSARLWLESAEECKLGHEPAKRPRARCTACKVKTEFPFDEMVGQLIAKGTFDGTRLCPYGQVNTALVLALLLGPGAEMTSKQADRTRIAELQKALTHLELFFQTFGPDRGELTDRREEDPLFAHIAEVSGAEFHISRTLEYLKDRYAENEKNRALPPSGGRRGNLELQAIATTMAQAWERLTGKLPAKNNVKFQNLLADAAKTVLGPLDPDTNWEWSARVGVKARKKNPPKESSD